MTSNSSQSNDEKLIEGCKEHAIILLAFQYMKDAIIPTINEILMNYHPEFTEALSKKNCTDPKCRCEVCKNWRKDIQQRLAKGNYKLKWDSCKFADRESLFSEHWHIAWLLMPKLYGDNTYLTAEETDIHKLLHLVYVCTLFEGYGQAEAAEVMGHRNRVAHWSEGVMVREERQDIVDSIIKFIKKFLEKANVGTKNSLTILHNLKDTASLDSLSDDGIKTEGLNIMEALYEQLNELLCSLSKSTILASNNVKFVIGDGNTTYIAENINIGIPPYPKNEDDVKPLALKFESEDDETPTGRNAGDGGKVQNDCEMNKQDGTVQMDEVFLKMIFRGEKFFKSEKPSQKHVAQLALKKLGIEAKLADSIQTLEDYVLKNGHGKKKPVYCLDNQIPTVTFSTNVFLDSSFNLFQKFVWTRTNKDDIIEVPPASP